MTNARQMPGGGGGKGWPRLELTEPLIEIFLISNCFTYIVEGEISDSIEIGCVFQFVFLRTKSKSRDSPKSSSLIMFDYGISRSTIRPIGFD